MTDYIGKCFLKIANHLSYRPNFINYTFRDDMISDGIENCLQYLDNFNPAKSNNPFAYFTQIIYYAFVRRIQKEKKQVTIKHKLIMDSNYDDVALQPGEDREFKNQFKEFLQKEVVPHIDKWEETGTIDRFIWEKFGEMGYFDTDNPRRSCSAGAVGIIGNGVEFWAWESPECPERLPRVPQERPRSAQERPKSGPERPKSSQEQQEE